MSSQQLGKNKLKYTQSSSHNPSRLIQNYSETSQQRINIQQRAVGCLQSQLRRAARGKKLCAGALVTRPSCFDLINWKEQQVSGVFFFIYIRT